MATKKLKQKHSFNPFKLNKRETAKLKSGIEKGIRQAIKTGQEVADVPFEKDRRKMNAAEAIMSFLSWASTREQPLILSRNHMYSKIVQVAVAFIDHHKLGQIRDGMQRKTHLPELDHVNNLPPTEMSIFTADDAYNAILDVMDKAPEKDRNKIIARFLQRVKERAEASQNYAVALKEEWSQKDIKTYHELQELNNILSGNYSVL